MSKTYRHIFFDLDRTLWDFEANSRETLAELFAKYRLQERGVASFEGFLERYHAINDNLWRHYLRGNLNKETLRVKRFYDTLKKYGIKDKYLTLAMSDDYIAMSPLRTNLVPHTREILGYLHKKYRLHIITNGFEEVQHIKINACKIDVYFEQVVTSDRAGAQKPSRKIFDYSLKLANALSHESVMIGDCAETDMQGARNAEMDHVFFNPRQARHNRNFTYEIASLRELMDIL
ncbi:MAG: YjjG family noncanonical pyrimidine nucleotidase [Bacteroidota bacterium]